MSGRDWRRFVCEHRKQMAEPSGNRKDTLQTAFLSGSRRHVGFSVVDYDELLQSVQIEKEKGNSRAKRVKELACKGKKSREDAVLQEHKKAWFRGQEYLLSEYRKCRLSVGSWASSRGTNASLDLVEVILELLEYECQLKSKRPTLQSLYEPIYQIKRAKISRSDNDATNSKAIHQIEKLKEEYENYQQLSNQECAAICKDLEPLLTCYNIDDPVPPTLRPKQLVPEEVWSLDCPTSSLRRSVAREFELLNGQFEMKAKKLRDRFHQLCKCNSWSREDRLHYSLVVCQYPSGIENRRRLCIDRLTRELPHKTRSEIVEYENCYRALEQISRQMDVLCVRWVESYTQLLEKARAVFVEACVKSERKEAMKEERQKQLDLCESLSRKVAQWREKCLLLHEAEMALVAKQMAAQEAKNREDKKKRREKNQQIRHAIAQYHCKKETERQKELLAQEKQVEEMKIMMKQQAKITKERVDFRNQLQKSKQDQQKAREERAQEEHQLKEDRLEALRQQVRVTAEADIERLIGSTEASRARLTTSEELALQHPLFCVYSFSDDEIMSDKRVRLTAALREAGLLSTHYAKTILSSIPPLHPPRPDQHSSIFQ